VSFKERDIADLLTLYGVKDEHTRTDLLTLATQANTPGWWHRYGSVLPAWFQAYIGLETAATLIRTYEVKFIPGLLQTEDYARAVILLGHSSSSPTDIEHRVQLRMQRQRSVFEHPGGSPRVWAVVDEAALRRPVGGPKVMRAQLQRLIEATAQPDIRLQVIPFSAGGYAAAGGPFTIMRFPDQEIPDVVYLELLTNALYLEKPEDTVEYALTMNELCIEAETPARTRKILERALRDLDSQAADGWLADAGAVEP
ncbi:MAG TPA: DUF5753 domain-containing protein, partial [Micromonosporaceae bacterium]|nr:DUF5753 domain-containing protein [Micromonosporaceae bacterium]